MPTHRMKQRRDEWGTRLEYYLPMPPSTQIAKPGSPQDKKVLIAMLTSIEEQLRILVLERPKQFRKDYLELLPGPWLEVQRRLETARKQIHDDQIDWQYVEGVGLTSKTALWKQKILTKSIRSGVWGRILKVCNAILGSLSGALPILEFVKEYKDCVEGCLRIIRSPEGAEAEV